MTDDNKTSQAAPLPEPGPLKPHRLYDPKTNTVKEFQMRSVKDRLKAEKKRRQQKIRTAKQIK